MLSRLTSPSAQLRGVGQDGRGVAHLVGIDDASVPANLGHAVHST